MREAGVQWRILRCVVDGVGVVVVVRREGDGEGDGWEIVGSFP